MSPIKCNACTKKATTTVRTAIEQRIREIDILTIGDQQDVQAFLSENRDVIDSVIDDISYRSAIYLAGTRTFVSGNRLSASGTN